MLKRKYGYTNALSSPTTYIHKRMRSQIPCRIPERSYVEPADIGIWIPLV